MCSTLLLLYSLSFSSFSSITIISFLSNLLSTGSFPSNLFSSILYHQTPIPHHTYPTALRDPSLLGVGFQSGSLGPVGIWLTFRRPQKHDRPTSRPWVHLMASLGVISCRGLRSASPVLCSLSGDVESVTVCGEV